MTSRLASLLVQEGLVAPKQMADAFQRQVIYGGTLDTILLEMNAVTEPAIIAALGRANALPTADTLPNIERLRAAGTLSWFPLSLAERFRAVPVAVEGHLVRVLTTDPPDRRALDELGLELGRAVEPQIAPEHRYVHAFSLLYDTPVSARFQSLQARLARRAAQAGNAVSVVAVAPSPSPAWRNEPRTVVTDLPIATAPVEAAAPRAAHDEQLTPRLTTREVGAPSAIVRETVAREQIAQAQVPVQAEVPPVQVPVPPPAAPAHAAPANRHEHGQALSMAVAVVAIDAATDRDEIFAALCRGARSRADYVALFTVHAETMVGRAAIAGEWLDRASLSALSLSLEVPSPFRTAAVGHAPLVGVVGEDENSHALLTALERPAPVPAVIVPIVLRERTVALLYADASGDALPAATLGELSNGAGAAARAFQRLILSAKGRDYRAAATAVPAAKPDANESARSTSTIEARPEAKVDTQRGIAELPSVTIDPSMGWRAGGPDGAGRLQATPADTTQTARHRGIEAPSSEAELLALFESVERGDERARASADRIVALGARGAELTVARLPGPVRIDRTSYRGVTPPLADHGPLLALISRFGEVALPYVERRVTEPSAEVRYYCTLALGEIARERRITRIGANLFDRDATVRRVSVDLMLRLPESAARTAIIESLRGELPGPDIDHQRMAADALGDLGDALSVPRLIELIKHPEAALALSARQALMLITKQDYGTSRWRWRGWWDRHKSEPRVDWMFEGLAHSDDDVRASAADELKRMFTEHFGYHWDAPKREREEARKRWVEWYKKRKA